MKSEPERIRQKIDADMSNLVRNYILGNCTGESIPLRNFINDLEKDMITKALRVAGGNQKVASFILGMKPTTMNEKIKKFKLSGTTIKIKEKKDLRTLINRIDLLIL